MEEHETVKRLRELLTDNAMTKREFEKRYVITSQIFNNWRTRGIAKRHILKLGEFFDVKPTWLETGRGEKYWRKTQDNINDDYNIHAKNIIRSKLDGILDIADKAIEDSNYRITDDIRIGLYLDAMNFSATREFTSDFIYQYVKELVREIKK